MSEEQSMKSNKFASAYSYLITKNQTTSVCFDENMKLTNNKLRGVNYVKLDGSCSCFIRSNVRYNVTINSYASGRKCYVQSHDCPMIFDYVIEYHKCYKMQYKILNWYNGRSLCNNVSNSHPITFDNDVENDVSLQYVKFVTPNYQVCPGSILSTYYTFYTSGIRTYFNGTRTPFLWSPYPGVYKTMQASNAWHVGEPNSLANGIENCVQHFVTGYPGWDDQPCSSPICMLCEYDLTD
ncbi:hypothetical protein HELRODRAFT_179272 [Helobdella robusta]|uniref:C-type lectin domain-containing protein n=1 Tax=Helobdella robusta TaxID=6412 RepID=T1FEG6_HELRO|nr:hypothetical protein HELRODRAFT_179272 [Helobdella robusta]ESN95498.1 hypothetical protein HELRODRAFT_179272 [Helobdella robusta]